MHLSLLFSTLFLAPHLPHLLSILSITPFHPSITSLIPSSLLSCLISFHFFLAPISLFLCIFSSLFSALLSIFPLSIPFTFHPSITSFHPSITSLIPSSLPHTSLPPFTSRAPHLVLTPLAFILFPFVFASSLSSLCVCVPRLPSTLHGAGV